MKDIYRAAEEKLWLESRLGNQEHRAEAKKYLRKKQTLFDLF